MTEKSYFQNGSAAGDAEYAPYDQSEFADLIKKIQTVDGAWVLPNQLNNLEVTPGAGRSVSVASGRALIYGYWYENDAAETVNLATNTSNYTRVDAVVVEIDTEANTASLVVLQGAPGNPGKLPVIGDCSTKLQLPLAYVALPSGYASVQSKYVLDQRRFLNNAYHINNYSTQNDFPNGLFLGWGDSENSGSSRRPMPGWKFTGAGTPPSVKDATRFDSMPYGRCVNIYEAGSTSTNGYEIGVMTYENSTDMMTFSMELQVNKDELSIDFGATTKTFPASEDTYQVIIRGNYTGPQTIKIYGSTGDAIFGDFRLAQGYCIAEQDTSYPQIIMFDAPVYAHRTFWGEAPPILTGLGSTTIVCYFEQWGSLEDQYSVYSKRIKGVIVRLRIDDTNSATATCIAELYTSQTQNMLRVYGRGAPNGEYRYRTGIIHVNATWSGLLYIKTTTSGTINVDVAVIGVIL